MEAYFPCKNCIYADKYSCYIIHALSPLKNFIQDTSMSNIIDSALYFAAHQFHVFPLLNSLRVGDNKLGTPVGWNHNKPNHKYSIPSTIDTDVVRGWAEYGEDLIGYGVNPRGKRALILDVDVGDGKVGLQSLNDLIFDKGLPKASFAVQSKSGGVHLYYAYPKVAVQLVGLQLKGYPHIDVRLENNFVVGPESFGGKYRIKFGALEAELKELPQSVIDILPIKSGTSSSTLVTGEETKQFSKPIISDFGEGVSDPLRGEIPEFIPKGSRDNTLIRLIGSWVRAGHTKNNIIALIESAIDKCEDGHELNINDYIEKMESTMQKASFACVQPEPLKFFIENAIYIEAIEGVYQIPDRRYFIRGLKSLYAPHIYYIETETSNGTKRREVNAFEAWKKSKHRKSVANIGYKPISDPVFFDKTQNCMVCNLYKSVVHMMPASDTQKELVRHHDVWGKFLALCEYLFGRKTELMLEWAAWQVQHPDIKLGFAPVIISEKRGVGKNLFFELISAVVGHHNTAIYSSDTIADSHNDHVLKSHLVLINESYVPVTDRYTMRSRSQLIEKIKMLITESSQSVNPKFIAPFKTTSYANYIFASNNLAAVPIEAGDRRFEIVICEHMELLSSDIYKTLWTATHSGELSMLLAGELYRQLKNIKIKTLGASYTPDHDEDKLQVRLAGMSDIEETVYHDIEDKQSIFVADVITFRLFLAYILEDVDPNATQSYCKAIFKEFAKPLMSPERKGIAKRLKLICPEITIKNQYVPEKIRYLQPYAVRNHEKWMRASSDKLKKEYIKAYCNFTGTPKDSVKIKKLLGKMSESASVTKLKPHITR